jgi:SAM-dependent methyltransferase
MAAGWEKKRAYLWTVSSHIGEWLITNLDVRPGQTILELACGTGDTGFAAAPLLGRTGKLIPTDFASKMVEAARRRGAELGLTNVEYRVMDAERMDLPDGSVAGVICRWGYMLMADPAAALRETRLDASSVEEAAASASSSACAGGAGDPGAREPGPDQATPRECGVRPASHRRGSLRL